MTFRPCIAVTTSYNKENKICMSPSYFNAIYKAGGIACFLPRKLDDIESYVKCFDGFLFAGGVDVHPAYYGEEIKSDSVELDSERDCFEMILLDEVMKTGKPVLGICRGIQLINVALGGSLYQHIDSHMQDSPKNNHSYRTKVTKDSLLHRIVQTDTLYVNSFHHQAVKKTAPSLEVCAVSDDDIVEGIYLKDYRFFLGVQWHPEMYYDYDNSAFNIFSEFISASEQK